MWSKNDWSPAFHARAGADGLQTISHCYLGRHLRRTEAVVPE